MTVRTLLTLVVPLLVLALGAPPAVASLGAEVAQGRAVAAQMDGGGTRCATLADDQFEHLGEYVMDQMAGSRTAHAAMNARMERALGTGNTDRMHELMGRRFAGCGAGNASSVPFGTGMMGAGAQMIGSSAWSWMRDDHWQRMSAADWNDLAGSMMGTRYTTHHRWSSAALVVGALGLVALGALLTVLLFGRARRDPPPTAHTTA